MKKIFLCILLLSYMSLSLTAGASKSIMILDFENKGCVIKNEDNAERTDQYYSRFISNTLQTKLVNSPVVSIVERSKLETSLKEQALSQTGFIDEKTAIEAGRLIGARKLIYGEYQCDEKKRFTITIKLMDIEKGTIDDQWIIPKLEQDRIKNFTANVADSIIALIKYFNALDNIANIENQRAPFSVRITAEKKELQIGDVLYFTVESDRDCYLQLFDIGTSGSIYLLFPNATQKNNFLKCGKKLIIDNILVQPPVGTEVVKVVATLDSISLNQTINFAGNTSIYNSLGSDIDQFARDLAMMVSPIQGDRWVTATLKLEIRERN